MDTIWTQIVTRFNELPTTFQYVAIGVLLLVACYPLEQFGEACGRAIFHLMN